jgi:hypothetical protein
MRRAFVCSSLAFLRKCACTNRRIFCISELFQETFIARLRSQLYRKAALLAENGLKTENSELAVHAFCGGVAVDCILNLTMLR